ncbi:MAG: beta/gamma crystallin-related protein [Rubrivivax sp.]
MTFDLRALLAAVPLLLAAAGAKADLVLYQDDGFRGRSFATGQSVRNLAEAGFNDRASSVMIRSGNWLLCTDAEFRGQCITLGPGRYPSLRPMGLNDNVSSLREADRRDGRWNEAQPPQIFMDGNRFGRVIFDNGCMVFYDPLGRRGQSRGGCNERQLRRADDAMTAYRREQGHDRYDDGSLPHLVVNRNGSGEAIYANNCVVQLSPQGRRVRSSPQCTPRQLSAAEAVMAEQIRSQTRY